MTATTTLTAKQFRFIMRRRQAAASWATIRDELGLDIAPVDLQSLYTAKHEAEKERRRKWNEDAALRAEKRMIERRALRERIIKPDEAPSITALICGDPPLHRSGLVQRLNAVRETMHERDPLDDLIFRP